MEAYKRIFLFLIILGLILTDVILFSELRKNPAEAQTCVNITPTCQVIQGGSRATCPAGTILMGGACNGGYGNDSAVESLIYESAPGVAASNTSASIVYCDGDGGHNAQAMCCHW